MKQVALIFPGQGSQYTGMCSDFFEFDKSKEIFDIAKNLLNYDIKHTILKEPQEILSQTEITQPAVFVTSVICYEVFKSKITDKKIDVKYVAGHSLGEYTALYSGGVFDFETGLKLVISRSNFIKDASSKVKGIMAAIIGLDENKINQICSRASEFGVVEPVNFNSPQQIVISGEIKSVEYACNLSKQEGALKSVILNVSGPFHSSLMKEASNNFEIELNKYELHNSTVPVVMNLDAIPTVDSNQIKMKMVKQISNPILWSKTIKFIIDSGIKIFIEIGPGKVLSGLIKRIDKSSKVYNIEDNKSLEFFLKEIN